MEVLLFSVSRRIYWTCHRRKGHNVRNCLSVLFELIRIRFDAVEPYDIFENNFRLKYQQKIIHFYKKQYRCFRNIYAIQIPSLGFVFKYRFFIKWKSFINHRLRLHDKRILLNWLKLTGIPVSFHIMRSSAIWRWFTAIRCGSHRSKHTENRSWWSTEINRFSLWWSWPATPLILRHSLRMSCIARTCCNTKL